MVVKTPVFVATVQWTLARQHHLASGNQVIWVWDPWCKACSLLGAIHTSSNTIWTDFSSPLPPPTSAEYSWVSILIRPICSPLCRPVAVLLAKLSFSPHTTGKMMALPHSQTDVNQSPPPPTNLTIAHHNKTQPNGPHVTLWGSLFNKLLNQTTKRWLRER